MNFKIIKGDMVRNKLRTVAILGCITLAIALLYASSTTFQIVLDAYKDSSRVLSGNSDFIISSGKIDSKQGFSLCQLPTKLNKSLDYIIDAPNILGSYHADEEDIQILMRGLEVNEVEQMGIFEWKVEPKNSREGNMVYVNIEYASRFDIEVGDWVDFEIMGEIYSFQVNGIFTPKSMYQTKACENQVIVEKAFLKHILQYSKEETNMLYVKCVESADLEEIETTLKNTYQGQLVQESFSVIEYEEKMQGIQIVFVICTIMILIMCCLIVYNVFRVIYTQRLRMLGILRSIGAKKENIYSMVIMEGILYGSIGGIAGCVMGILTSFGMSWYLKPESMAQVSVEPSIVHILLCFLAAVFICLFVSYQAGKTVSRKPIKELLLEVTEAGEKKRKERQNRYISWAGILLLVGNIIFSCMVSKDSSMNLLVVIILLTLIALLCAFPRIIHSSICAFEKITINQIKHVGYLAIQDIKTDQNMKRSILLIAISVSTILMTNSALNSIVSSNIKTLKNNYNCDYVVTMNQEDNSIMEKIREIDNVEKCQLQRYVESVSVIETEEKVNDYEIYNIDGYEDSEYLNFRNFNIDNELFDNNKKRSILITNSIRIHFDLKEGDSIGLQDKNGHKKIYQIAGFFDTSINNGSYALIPQKYLEEDFGTLSRFEIYVKTNGEQEQCKKELEKKLEEYRPSIQSVDEMVEDLFENSKMTLETIQLISVLPMIVSFIILSYNAVISFSEKKKYYAILRAVGIDKKNIRKMLIQEYVLGGVLSACLGVLGGNLLIFQIRKFLSAIGNTMPVQHSIILSLSLLLLTILFYIMPAVVQSIQAIKFNIGREVRYRE